MINTLGHFLHNLLYFGRLLRAMGLDVQPDGISNLVRATKWISIDQELDFYHAARGLLVRRHQDLAAFNRAFQLFFRSFGDQPTQIGHQPNRPQVASVSLIDQERLGKDSITLTPRVRYSAEEVLREKDFAELDEDELELIKPLLAELAWKLGTRLTRRWRRGGGQQIDIRQMLRQSLRHEGELLLLPYRSRRSNPRRLVVIADISGSMERYSSLLLHFMFGLSESLEQWTEAFVFGTRLTRVSHQMRGHNVERALSEVAKQVPDWSGGTRIGHAIKTFNYQWTRRVLTRGAVVIVVSDGWDRGEVDLLRAEMARLQRSSFRLIWLNPLLGSSGYEPRTRGMQAALPFVDDFLPIRNLSSLEQLARKLETLDERRPARKQHLLQMSPATPG